MAKKTKDLATMKDLENLYAAEATIAAQAAPAADGVPRISASDQMFRIGDQELPDPLNVIVVAESLLNVYYEEDYDPKDPAPPACFALGDAVKDGDRLMVSDPSSPNRQGGTEFHCSDCEMNQYGSAEKGGGKACSNRRRLCLVMPDDPAFGDQQDLRYAFLDLSPTALTSWGKFVGALNKIEHRPPHGVITRLSFNKKDPIEQRRKAVIPIGYVAINDLSVATKVNALRKEVLESRVMLRPLPVTVADRKPEKPAKAKARPARKSRGVAKAVAEASAPKAPGRASTRF